MWGNMRGRIRRVRALVGQPQINLGATPMDDEDYANWLGERVFRCMADMTDEDRSMFLFHVGGEEPEMMARQLDEWVPGWRIRYAQP